MNPIDTYKEKAELIIADHDDQFCGEGESAPTDPVTLKRLEAAALDLLVDYVQELHRGLLTCIALGDSIRVNEYLKFHFAQLENRRKEIE